MTTLTHDEVLDFPRFRTAVSESFVPLKVTTEHPDPFHGTIRHLAADTVHFSIVHASDHAVERTPALIASTQRRYFKVGVQLAGTGVLVQNNRETLLQPGSVTIYDTDKPYSLAFEEHFRSLVMMFPAHAVDLPLTVVDQLTATPLERIGSLGPLVARHLTGLAADLTLVQGPGGARLARNTVDLIVTLLSHELASGRIRLTSRQQLFNEIVHYIDEHLAAPDLGATRIAAAHFISPRHLQSLFHENDATVATWVRGRRLEQCRQRLLDPGCDHRSIGSIAAEWGFVDAAHFSRAFRAAFGCTPSELRAAR